MNTATEGGPYPPNHRRPFYYTQPTIQRPLPNLWYMNHAYSPFIIQGPGFRAGNPYFPPFAFPLQEYPSYVFSQPQVPQGGYRRPYFNPHFPAPLYYHATRFRHYSCPAKKMETKETQTDPREAGKMNRYQSPHVDLNVYDARNVEGAESGIESVNTSVSAKADDSLPVSEQIRGLVEDSPPNSPEYKEMPLGSFAFEKEEVRIQYANGTPTIQLWNSYEETIPIYDASSSKPDNLVQKVHSCEGVVLGPHYEKEESVLHNSCSEVHKDEQETFVPSDVCLERDSQVLLGTEKGMQQLANQNMKPKADRDEEVKVKLDARKENKDMKHVDSSEARTVRQDHKSICKVSISSKITPQDADTSNEEKCAPSTEEMDTSPHDKSPNTNDSLLQENNSNLWTDSFETYMPSESWLACFDNMDTDYNYEMYLQKRNQKHQSILSFTSDEMSSRDEGSSMDSSSVRPTVAYFVPSFMLKKHKSSLGSNDVLNCLEKDRVKSSGAINKDEGIVPRKLTSAAGSCSHVSWNFKNPHADFKLCNENWKQTSSSLAFHGKQKCYTKKTKGSSLSDSEQYHIEEEDGDEENGHEYEEEDDDDDDDFDDEEYSCEETVALSKSVPTASCYLKHPYQKLIICRQPHGSIHLPHQTVKAKLHRNKTTTIERTGNDDWLVQEKQQAFTYDNYSDPDQNRLLKVDKKQKDARDAKKVMQKFSGGRIQKDTAEVVGDENWTKYGAKPKLSEPPRNVDPAPKIKDSARPPKSSRGFSQPSSKFRPTRSDCERSEIQEDPKFNAKREQSKRRGANKRR
ncbi:uncharacterized protein LOC122796481 [Protopterus annectens]|uniref:uncharacterized protein LOC122796481 n=1 Tax=Protopterus annectens TaxID=7888 RepID=UPI001CFAEBAD|nr:uncharacterized protein LOC122796481 [Protopterus annectens]